MAEKLQELSRDEETKHIVLAQEVFAKEYDAMLEGAAEFPYETARPEKPYMLGDGLKMFSDFEITGLVRKPWKYCNGRLEDGSDCLTAKGAAYFTVRIEGIELVGVDVHFDSGKSVKDEEAKTLQMQQFIGDFNDIVRDRPAIVTGDFNTINGVPLGIMKLGTGLQDVCGVLTCPDQRIDRVYFKNTPWVTLTPKSYTLDTAIFVDEDGEPLSDHLPIFVDWNIKIGPQHLHPLIDHFSQREENEEEPQQQKGLEGLLAH
ncbi:MAG: hypothetical protein A3D92_05605 [Bacteroidetes bacterium RIFCSPHIGHO2_02_FULL_44_7]|nr:MAG: hypothetical protein A3D92_05605 [Bacteroidetes bacterium RIFCSPHIGHO2_02_FULL_44_7]